jgi:hypothetical protein
MGHFFVDARELIRFRLRQHVVRLANQGQLRLRSHDEYDHSNQKWHRLNLAAQTFFAGCAAIDAPQGNGETPDEVANSQATEASSRECESLPKHNHFRPALPQRH